VGIDVGTSVEVGKFGRLGVLVYRSSVVIRGVSISPVGVDNNSAKAVAVWLPSDLPAISPLNTTIPT
jgi:hypothetical protein